MSISYQKQALRQRFTEEASKNRQAKDSPDKDLTDRLFSLPILADTTSICIYVSKPDEVTTHQIIKRLLEENYLVSIPKVQPQNQLSLHRISSFSELSSGAFGVLEPDGQTPRIPPAQVDLFFIPGLFFDPSGNRLGRGLGYYDRLLADVEAIKIGLAYEWQIISLLPIDPHDIKVDYILTDLRLISCTPRSLPAS